MRSQIKRLLAQHGELTFRELCAALNCYTEGEVLEAKKSLHGLCSPIGEVNIHGSTILRRLLVEPATVQQTRFDDVQAMPSW